MNGNLIDQLPDIHLPPEISWWPPAIGWWVISLLVLAALIYLGFKLRARHKANAYRSDAKAALEQLKSQYSEHGEAQIYLQDMLVLLRSLVKTAYPNTHWEALPTQQLLSKISGKNKHLNQIDATLIEAGLYKKSNGVEPLITEQFYTFLAKWIRQHRRGNTC